MAHLQVAVQNLRAKRFYEKHGWVSTARQRWMDESSWVATRPAELRDANGAAAADAQLDERGGLSEAEFSATSMRGVQFKKWLGYEQQIVPRLRSYASDPHKR